MKGIAKIALAIALSLASVSAFANPPAFYAYSYNQVSSGGTMVYYYNSAGTVIGTEWYPNGGAEPPPEKPKNSRQ